MALTLCELIERWIDSKSKLKDFKIIPVVRAQGQPFMGDIMLWLPDMQRFPVGYIDDGHVDIFVPKPKKDYRGLTPGYTMGLTIWPDNTASWKILYPSSPSFFKDLEKHLLLIASRWK